MKERRAIALGELLAAAGVTPIDILGNPAVGVAGICTHAQQTRRNEIFAAIIGTRIDSHLLLAEAVDAGASVLLVERPTAPYPGVTIVQVADTRAVLGPLAHALRGNPARAMKVCGVTGTNGKTTTAHLIHSIVRDSGGKPGLIGTLGMFFGGKSVPTITTTPGPLELAEVFEAMEDERIDTVVMEASSHAIDQKRIGGIPFRSGIFLNLTQDHLDYHGTMEAYGEAKRRLFSEYVLPTPGSIACFHLDDAMGRRLAGEYSGEKITFSKDRDTDANVRGTDIELSVSRTSFTLWIDGWSERVSACIGGLFGIDNLLAAAAGAYSLGVSPDQIASGLRNAPPVPGRFEMIDEGQPFSVVVDYAHCPDALERLLRSARRICPGKLIVVFGCGGDRDKIKRPIMGQIAGDHADFVVVTTDNPRTEIPELIGRQIVEGIHRSPLKSNRYHVVLDRRAAIEQALTIAAPGDVVVIAGKGHENYQDVGSTRLPFDDRTVARELLRAIATEARTPAAYEQLMEQRG